MKLTKKLLVSIALLLLPLTLPAQQITKSGRGYESTLTQSYDVGAGGELVMRRITGDVSIAAWNNNRVEIKHEIRMDVHTQDEAKEIVERAVAGYAQRGSRIQIEGSFSRGRDNVQHRFTISVPRNFNVQVQTSGGDISVVNISGRIDLNTSGGDINLNKISGEVDFRTSGGDIELRSLDGQVTGRTSGGDIDIEDVKGRIDVSTSGGNVRVLRSTATAQVSTSGGEITLREVSARLDASTSGGSIYADNCTGELRLRTSGGDLRLSGLRAPVRGSTSGGDVQVRDADADLDLRTSGGDIEMRDIRAGVAASTSGGDIDVEITLKDFKKPHIIDLSTSAGSITLTIPEKLPASIRAELVLDRRSWRASRSDIFTDFPLAKSQEEERGRGTIIRATGDINGGGDSIYLRTSDGDIRIRKAQ